eukprot:860834_1
MMNGQQELNRSSRKRKHHEALPQAQSPNSPKKKKRRRKSKSKCIGRKHKKKTTTAGQGNGSDVPYRQELRDIQNEQRKETLRTTYKYRKKIKEQAKEINTQNNTIIDMNETNNHLMVKTIIQEEVTNQVVASYDVMHRAKERIAKQLNYTQLELDKILNQLENVMDSNNDDDVYVPVPIEEDESDENAGDEFVMFGIQGMESGCKKYKRYNIKVIMLAIDLAKKTTPQHIPQIIRSVLCTYTGSVTEYRIPTAVTIRFWIKFHTEGLNNFNIIKTLKEKQYQKLHLTEQHDGSTIEGKTFSVSTITFKQEKGLIERNEQVLLNGGEEKEIEEQRYEKIEISVHQGAKQ